MLPDHQPDENQIFVFGLYEMKKEDKSKFVFKHVGTIVIQLLSCKNIFQTVTKIFVTQCFYTDHLNNKIENKANCRTPSVKPPQL